MARYAHSLPAVFALVLALVPAVPLRAQGAAGGSVSMRLDLVAWGNDISGLTLKSGKKNKKATAMAYSYSEPVSYTGPRLLQIHHDGNTGPATKERVLDDPELGGDDTARPYLPTAKEKAEEAKDIPPLLAKLREKDATLVSLVKLPANSRRATILLEPGPAGTFRAHVINDDPSKLPLGRLRVHNLSPLTIALNFNGSKKPVQLKPRQSIVVSPKNGHVIYELAYKENGVWEVQENNLIRVRPDEQVQFVILKSNNSYFLSSSGSKAGYLQYVTLRRQPNKAPAPPPADG